MLIKTSLSVLSYPVQQKYIRLHPSLLSLAGAVTTLVALLFLSAACRVDFRSSPGLETTPQPTQTITSTRPIPLGTPPTLIKPEIYLSDSEVAMDYPALRVITVEISLKEFAESWHISGIEKVAALGADPTEIKMKWIQAYNPMITTTLFSKENIILHKIEGTPIMAEQLLSYVNEATDGSTELSQADHTYTLLFLNPVDKDCFEASIGVSLSSLAEFNPIFPTLEDNNIPANTILFVPRRHVHSPQELVSAPTSCRSGGG